MEKAKKQFKLSILFRYVAITAFAILIVPVLIFFFGWLKWYLAVLFSGILLFGVIWMIKKDYWSNADVLEIPIFHFVLIVAVFGVWILFSGSCGVGAPITNGDLPYRNAYLRDLTEFNWPVYYPETDVNLCYYYIFWMIPALFGKILGVSVAFFVQWLWILLIVLTSFLLITYLLKDYNTKTFWLICVFIILWSGMNLVGTLVCDILGHSPYGIAMSSMEGWCDGYGGFGEPFEFIYRSNQDSICQIYNQILVWIAVPLYLQSRKIHNYAMIGLLLLPFSPWGTLGLALIMIIDAKYHFNRDGFKFIIREIFSVQNICSITSLLIVFGLFFASNSRTNVSQGGGIGMLSLNRFDFDHIMEIILFWLCEFGIYCLFIKKFFQKDYLFKVVILLLMLIPLFWIGGPTSRDFCMNASLPALYILMIYMIIYIKDEVMGKILNFKHFVLIICLITAAYTPIFDIAAKTKVMCANKSFAVQNDWFYTFSNKDPDTLQNQAVKNSERTVFFKYLAKLYKDGVSAVSDELSDIKSIIDIDMYFDYLLEKNCTIYIAVQDIQGFYMGQETANRLKQLGFSDEIDLLLDNEYHSFIGILNNGYVVTQQIGGDEHISYSDKFDGYPVAIESATLNTGNFSVINIKGRDYSVKGRGLNIVVRDNQTDCVIDSVAFDTHIDSKTCTRQ